MKSSIARGTEVWQKHHPECPLLAALGLIIDRSSSTHRGHTVSAAERPLPRNEAPANVNQMGGQFP